MRAFLWMLLGALIGACLGAWRWYSVFSGDMLMAVTGAFFGGAAGVCLSGVIQLLYSLRR